jgi:hypothetical protein
MRVGNLNCWLRSEAEDCLVKERPSEEFAAPHDVREMIDGAKRFARFGPRKRFEIIAPWRRATFVYEIDETSLHAAQSGN